MGYVLTFFGNFGFERQKWEDICVRDKMRSKLGVELACSFMRRRLLACE